MISGAGETTQTHKYIVDTNQYDNSMLDLWYLRGHRSAPMGQSDDQFIDNTARDGRHGDAGISPYYTNNLVTDGNGTHPDKVMDKTTTTDTIYAYKVTNRLTTLDYWMADSGVIGNIAGTIIEALSYVDALTTGYVPAEGDTVTKRIQRDTVGSRGDIYSVVNGDESFFDNDTQCWTVYLARDMDTGNDTDDIQLFNNARYEVGFAIHENNSGHRDHYISLPYTFGFGTQAAGSDIAVVEITGVGNEPDFSDTATFFTTNIEVFLPGITTFEYLTGTQQGPFMIGNRHGGADTLAGAIDGEAITGCRSCHVVRADDPNASMMIGGALETRVARRGGIFGHTPVSLRYAVLPVLESRCLSCHQTGGTAAGFSFGASGVANIDIAFLTIRGKHSNFITYVDSDVSNMLIIPGTNSDTNHPATGVLAGFNESKDYTIIKYWLRYNAPRN